VAKKGSWIGADTVKTISENTSMLRETVVSLEVEILARTL
jgi:hypothetical protein